MPENYSVMLVPRFQELPSGGYDVRKLQSLLDLKLYKNAERHMMQVAKNKVVAIHYTLTNDAGEILDTSDGGDPLNYLHGVGNLIPGLEDALEGKLAGDQMQVSVPPSQGYGERDEQLRQTVSRENFSDVDDLEIGMQFQVDAEGGEVIVTVVEIGDDEVTLDANHELAGMTLHFDVTVRDVREATDEELKHGHVHDAGCDH